MTDPRNLKKINDILNSEGCILGLYLDPKDNLYFGSYLKDGTGTIFYLVNEVQIKSYLKSKLTLMELYVESKSFLIKHKFRKEVKTYLKEDFLDSIQCGTDFYKDIPKSMKSEVIERKYGR
jgi:hypothetical protein